jgi:hypothetical protein
MTGTDTASRATGRRLPLGQVVLMAAVPVLTAAVVAPHPAEPRDIRELAGATATWLNVHLALLVAVPLIGVVVWRLLRDVDNRAATVSRLLLAPAVALYAAFDALLGIGTGVLMRGVHHLHDHHHDGAWALAQHWWDVPLPIMLVSIFGPLCWALAIGAAALAHRLAGSHWLVVVGLALTAVVFAWGHPGVTGVIAMGGLLTAVLVHELGAWRAEAAS